MIFDTWGGSVEWLIQELLLQYMERIVAGLEERKKTGQRIPILFTQKWWFVAEKNMAIGCDGIGLDGQLIPVRHVVVKPRDKVVFTGQRVDPNALFATPEVVAAEAKKYLIVMVQVIGHVFNLGHGISQFTPTRQCHGFVSKRFIRTAVYYVSKRTIGGTRIYLCTEFLCPGQNFHRKLLDSL